LVTGPRTHVTGRTWLTGQSVRVEGRFERELRIAGQTVQLAGEMAQPVTVIAEKLEVLPSARIQGPLNYKSPTEASIAPAAACQRNAWRRCAMRRDKARCSEAPCW
jgi:hypothetical protein